MLRFSTFPFPNGNITELPVIRRLIRASSDLRLLAPTRGLSQLVTPFIRYQAETSTIQRWRMDLNQKRVLTKPELISFPVQTLAQLRSAGYVRRRSSAVTPPDSPTPSFMGELVDTIGCCHQPPALTLPLHVGCKTGLALGVFEWESNLEASFALRCFQRL